MTLQEKIQVMQAYTEGKQIESRSIPGDTDWEVLTEEPLWNWEVRDYRVKTGPQYRAYETAEEMLEGIKEHGNYVKDDNTFRMIKKFTELGDVLVVTLSGMRDRASQEINWEDITWADGTPFGKLVEE